MRYVVIFLLFMKMLFAVEVVVDTKETTSSELKLLDKKHYFGEQLFKGKFKENRTFKYNPDYIVNVDDKISVKMWGAHNYVDENLTVDKQGNIFIPEVGAIHLLGVKASNVQSVVQKSVQRVFNRNVSVYADVKQYQTISVFVSGAVVNAGLYNGLSTDSVLQFLDKAGGIIRGEGSYRNIEIMRNNSVVYSIDLYDFLVTGSVESFQFRSSDVILVKPVESFVVVEGDVQRPYSFELFNGSSVADLIKYALPKSTVNSFIVTTWNSKRQEITKEYPLSEAEKVMLSRGDRVKFVSNYYVETIEVAIEGEHRGTNFISVPKGTTLFDVLERLNYTPLSDIKNIHFYREKVARVQQQLVDIKLKSLESKILTRDSSSKEEAEIYQAESERILEFIKRAKETKQKGQVLLRATNNLKKIILEQGDRIKIPKKSNVVVIQGEVSVPSALAYDETMSLNDYIEFCGGYTDQADEDKVLLIKANGRVIKLGNRTFNRGMKVEAGDSILVLQKVETKNMLFFKDITQILYQIAIGAAVVLQF